MNCGTGSPFVCTRRPVSQPAVKANSENEEGALCWIQMENKMRLFTLRAKYYGKALPEHIYSGNETVLRLFGIDHFQQTRIKPDVTLIDPEGKPIGVIDKWTGEWVEP